MDRLYIGTGMYVGIRIGQEWLLAQECDRAVRQKKSKTSRLVLKIIIRHYDE